jgi:hypothetical protein
MSTNTDQGLLSDAGPRGTDMPGLPSVSLPKGGGAIRGIGETFRHNAVTGTGSITVPLAASTGRNGFGPTVALAYDSGVGNGPLGLGWRIDLPSITRRTDLGLPRYRDDVESDIFLNSGEDLTPLLHGRDDTWTREIEQIQHDGRSYSVEHYRPRVEQAFSRIQKWHDRATGETHWRIMSRTNVTVVYGGTSNSRIADPAEPSRVFTWLPSRSWNDRGDAMEYVYRSEDDESVPDLLSESRRDATANRYLKRISYANLHPFTTGGWPHAWHFHLVFDYGDHGTDAPRVEPDRPWRYRADPFSAYRSGFEIRTRRLCRRVLMFHAFPELGPAPVLTRSTDIDYDEQPEGSRLVSVRRSLYLRNDKDGTYTQRDPATHELLSPASLPPLEFDYAPLTVSDELHTFDHDSDMDMAVGAPGAQASWVDLDGEGLPGILHQQRGAWLYKRNASRGETARFDPARYLPNVPSPARPSESRQMLLDLAQDGHLCLVQYAHLFPAFSSAPKRAIIGRASARFPPSRTSTLPIRT